MKSLERYELLMKALSEGKSMSEAAREQNVTCALLSQVKKKHTPVNEQCPVECCAVQKIEVVVGAPESA
jgi:hypothetical protein